MTAPLASPDFARRIIDWQKHHGRHDLPWQNTCDAYRIWLSEIMLQQTQVSTVIPYYQRFLVHYPSVTHLAQAPQDAVLALWAGLGYYARARNLHRAAQAVASQYGGHFPTRAGQLAELPGIGRSTAAAIAAFAAGERAAILDGNVKRVLCRHYAIEGDPGTKSVETALWKLAEQLLPASDMAAYTQGIMDLGATLCTRSKPRCGDCPLASSCQALALGRQAWLPTARARKTVPERQAAFLLLTDGERIFLRRRPENGIWGGLLAPPEAETCAEAMGMLQADSRETQPLVPQAMPVLRHAFTHFRLSLHPYLVVVGPEMAPQEAPGTAWLTWDDALQAGLPAPIKKLLLAARRLASSPDSGPSDRNSPR